VPLKTIQTAFRAWEEGDAQAVFRLMAPQLKWRVIGSTEVSGTYQNKSAFLDTVNLKLMRALSGPLTPKVERIFAAGNTVVAQFTSHAPTNSGIDYTQTYCWVMEVSNGQIQSGTAYLDTALIDQVLN
jgi:hypothetical protein